MGKKRSGTRFIIQNHLGEFVKGTNSSDTPTFSDSRDEALGFDTKREAEYWAMDKQVMGFDISKFDPSRSGGYKKRGSSPPETGRGPGDLMRSENKQEINKLRNIVKDELKNLTEDKDKTEAMDANLEKLDEVKRSLGRLRKSTSDQAWKGYFNRGDMEKLEQKFNEVREILKDIEGIIINERGRR